MRRSLLILFAKQVIKNALLNKAVLVLLGIIALLLVYAGYSGAKIYSDQTANRIRYQQEVREHWEDMPDKHPHRMAHYGYIAFRPKHPLSVFDFGIESYTGNAVFLEAHKQNSVNFSEAGFSSGMLRFGEISLAMILQVLLPLVIFFVGFNTVAADRENGTLKILLSQGATWKEIITGKTIGLLAIALPVLFFAVIVLMLTGFSYSSLSFGMDEWLRILLITFSYAIYLAIVSLIAVLFSSVSKTARLALVSLIGVWLLFVVILPRASQAAGAAIFPSLSKIEFEAGIESDLIKKGDSHDPNDPYYKGLKDSLLKVYKVDSIVQLPFNYSGFQMKEGERISAEIYQQHLQALLDNYTRQNSISRILAFVNPFAAQRNLSMGLSGTDFNTYSWFQQQAEDYRYQLAQQMNELQIKLISNRRPAQHEAPHSISRDHWKAFPDFAYQRPPLGKVVEDELGSLAALLLWAAMLVVLVAVISKKLKAV
jgi:ABC-2 type transport system permease protein